MNLPTIVIATVVLAVFVAIVAGEVRKKKQGKSSCSCGCSGCSADCGCHK